MKTFLTLIAGILLTTQFSFAQKIYSTKTAVISFSATGGAEKIAAINSEADCKMADNGQIIFTLLIKGFHFENQLMEDHFNENYMESTVYPKSTFKGYITNMDKVNLTKDGTYKAEADGTLAIHGVEQKVKTSGIITVTGGKPVLTAVFKIKLKDYKISGSYIGDKIAPVAAINVNAKFQ